jgi:phosphodiesterase/alkaline phosphatase D-like protein
MGRIVSACLIVIVSTGIAAGAAQEHGPFMADGIKIGEVRQDSAIVWTRLTRYLERTIHGLAWTPKDEAVPQGRTLDAMEGSVPGATGEVRVIYWPRTSEKDRRTTSWQAVDPGRDFTLQFRLDGLAAGMQYQLEIQGRPAGATEPSCTLSGGFKTAPMPDVPARVALTVVTCQEYPRRDDPQNGHRIYSWMRKLDPDTGVREYACGPSSDQHAGGFSESMRTSMHHYLRICGGFLVIVVEREDGKPSITFRHYSTTGTVNHEDTFIAK